MSEECVVFASHSHRLHEEAHERVLNHLEIYFQAPVITDKRSINC